MLRHGSDGMRQASEDAVLNANYIRAGLKDIMSVPFPDHPAMHEALFDDRFLKDTGVTTLDFAKAMIDEGFHPMTVYFPLVVHGAMLIEPTESESRASLDLFIAALRDLVFAAKAGKTERFTRSAALRAAPPPRRDARRAPPVLKWTPPGALRGGGGVRIDAQASRGGASASNAKPHVPDRSAHLAGIGLMLLAMLMFSMNDALGKWLVATYSVAQILLVRIDRRASSC